MAKKSLNVILDLDQTLISGELMEEFDADGFSDRQSNFDFYDMDQYYLIFERPHLQEFLDHVFENYNVSVWTAASKSYALSVVENVVLKKKNRKLDWFFFCYHCSLSEKKKGSQKDLSMLWSSFMLDQFDEKNTLLIDDLKEIKNSQPENCVCIPEFSVTEKGSEDDDYLLRLMDILPLVEERAREKKGKLGSFAQDLLAGDTPASPVSGRRGR